MEFYGGVYPFNLWSLEVSVDNTGVYQWKIGGKGCSAD